MTTPLRVRRTSTARHASNRRVLKSVSMATLANTQFRCRFSRSRPRRRIAARIGHCHVQLLVAVEIARYDEARFGAAGGVCNGLLERPVAVVKRSEERRRWKQPRSR